mmetsp:Transcript_52134/g.106309  ORF Transcript_52134/g.106309 Transcript_52134/m.106309 type:complete len:188 (-) Transcript_52134:111-674(-)
MFVLVIGDMHIPHRVSSIPEKFKALLKPEKIESVICTGNLCSKEQFDYLKSLSSEVHIVKGDFDDGNYPDTKVARIHDWKFGICHGHQIVPWGDKEAMAMMQRQLDVDVLITGHTHKFAVDVHEGSLFVNPGSATGAYSGMQSEVVPSFVLLDVQESKLTIYVYELVPSEADPDQMELKVKELKHSK